MILKQISKIAIVLAASTPLELRVGRGSQHDHHFRSGWCCRWVGARGDVVEHRVDARGLRGLVACSDD